MVTSMLDRSWFRSNQIGPMLKSITDHVGEVEMFHFNLECCRRLDHLIFDDTSRDALNVVQQFVEGNSNLETMDLARERMRNVLTESKSRWEEADRKWAEAIRDRNYEAARVLARDRVKVEERLAHAVYHATIPNRNLWYSAWQTAEGCCGALEYYIASTEDPIFGNTDSNATEVANATRRTEREAQVQILRDFYSPATIREFAGEARTPDETKLQQFGRDGSVVRSIAESILSNNAFEKMPILADALEESGCQDEEVLEHCRADQIHHAGCWVLKTLAGSRE